MEPKRQKLDPDKVDEINDEACYIDEMPNEILLNIFNYLTQNQLGRVARVCRRWNVMTKCPVLWRNVNVTIFCSSDKERDAQFINTFIDGMPSCVTFIRLGFPVRPWRAYLNFEELCMKLYHSCPHVEVLILSNCDILTGLPEVINSCTQFLEGLKKLVLHNCQFVYYSEIVKLKDNSNIEVLDLNCSGFPYCRKIQFSKLLSLKELRLARTNVDDDWFVGDASFLNQLHVLDLGWTWLTASTFRAIERLRQNLKELYLCNLHVFDGHLNINPIFPHLKIMCLWGTRVTCVGLVSLVRSCPSLVSVYVEDYVARSFAEHPFVVANRCKSGIVKSIDWLHNHVDYLYN